MTDVLLALSTMPDEAGATALARTLVEERLAACVNILPGIRSIYTWQGELHSDGEVLMMIKTTKARLAALRERLPALHPHDVPELIALPVCDGLPSYLEWVNQCTTD